MQQETTAAVANDTTAAFRAAAELATRKGGRLVAMVQYPHAGDPYLYTVLVDLSGPTLQQYVVWSYNVYDRAFFSGHYFEGQASRPCAYQEFSAIVARRIASAYPESEVTR